MLKRNAEKKTSPERNKRGEREKYKPFARDWK